MEDENAATASEAGSLNPSNEDVDSNFEKIEAMELVQRYANQLNFKLAKKSSELDKQSLENVTLQSDVDKLKLQMENVRARCDLEKNEIRIEMTLEREIGRLAADNEEKDRKLREITGERNRLRSKITQLQTDHDA